MDEAEHAQHQHPPVRLVGGQGDRHRDHQLVDHVEGQQAGTGRDHAAAEGLGDQDGGRGAERDHREVEPELDPTHAGLDDRDTGEVRDRDPDSRGKHQPDRHERLVKGEDESLPSDDQPDRCLLRQGDGRCHHREGPPGWGTPAGDQAENYSERRAHTGNCGDHGRRVSDPGANPGVRAVVPNQPHRVPSVATVGRPRSTAPAASATPIAIPDAIAMRITARTRRLRIALSHSRATPRGSRRIRRHSIGCHQISRGQHLILRSSPPEYPEGSSVRSTVHGRLCR